MQDRLAGEIALPDGSAVPGPSVRWVGRRHGADKIDAGQGRGVQSRSPIDCQWTSLMMNRCGSRTRPSTRPSTSRAGGRCDVSSVPACVPDGPTECRGSGSRARPEFVPREVMISERPAEAEDRAVPGHWEGDLVVGLHSSAIGTLVERTTRFTMVFPLPRMEGHGGLRKHNGPALAGHGAEAVRDAIASSIATLPKQLRRSLTWDQGAEMAQHRSCASTRGWRSTSATLTAHGSAPRTRTPTACCGNTSPRAPIWPGTPRPSWEPSPARSTADLARRSVQDTGRGAGQPFTLARAR